MSIQFYHTYKTEHVLSMKLTRDNEMEYTCTRVARVMRSLILKYMNNGNFLLPIRLNFIQKDLISIYPQKFFLLHTHLYMWGGGGAGVEKTMCNR